jgi:hypothetical protein
LLLFVHAGKLALQTHAPCHQLDFFRFEVVHIDRISDIGLFPLVQFLVTLGYLSRKDAPFPFKIALLCRDPLLPLFDGRGNDLWLAQCPFNNFPSCGSCDYFLYSTLNRA